MKIKQIPEDFVVNEIIKLKTSGSGDYTYFWLTKKNWTTLRAIVEIASRSHVSFKRFKFAGTKDKSAVTRQAVSVFKVQPEVLESLSIKDIKIEVIGFGNEAISLGTLTGNHFEIVVRDMKKGDFEILKNNSAKIKKSGCLNYFGPQRFGGGNTALIGKEIIKGRFEQAAKYMICYSEDSNEAAKKARNFAEKNWGRWKDILAQMPKFLGLEKAVLNQLVQIPTDYAGALRKLPKPVRRMYVHGYQSHIFNKALDMVKGARFTKAKKLPIPGYETKLGTDSFSKALKKVIGDESVDLYEFRCTRMPELASAGSTRSALFFPKKLKLGAFEKDELNPNKYKIKLAFELLKGDYATVLVKELFDGKIDGKTKRA
ncbi:MAG: tRNA pseudouridine(13) synthase TruD [archaeon]